MNIYSNIQVGSVGDSAATSRRDPAARLTGNNGLQFNQVLKEATSATQQRRSPAGAVTNLEMRNRMLEIARSNPSDASELAFGFAHNSLNMELLDVSDRPNIRYSATGELVSSETSRYFAEIRSAMQKERAGLYQSELEKGTPPSEILEQIVDFNDTMPTRFLEMAGW
jgi:hypothetical protein